MSDVNDRIKKAAAELAAALTEGGKLYDVRLYQTDPSKAKDPNAKWLSWIKVEEFRENLDVTGGYVDGDGSAVPIP